eukprot:TRINITY_DN108_c0_g1_i1.p1 TRINITY_DN108_c0_g1~~TRINITY_DN108_c0_g1_i1.p1  ORF type:complete len:131 (+),score=19.67 TRINITY_DN108_c0_g1_i1:44-436(+)
MEGLGMAMPDDYTPPSPDWESEVRNNLSEFAYGVSTIAMSRHSAAHAMSKARSFFTIRTLEGEELLVFMSVQGYRVVGVESEEWDIIHPRLDNGPVYDSLQSLLMNRSKLFAAAFQKRVAEQLSALAERR